MLTQEKQRFLNVQEAHQEFFAQLAHSDNDFISLPRLLDVVGDPRFESLQPIPDETMNKRVLFWLIKDILVPDNPDLNLTDPRLLAKAIAKRLAFISMAGELHPVPDHMKLDDPEINQGYFERTFITSKLYTFLFWFDNNFGNEQQIILGPTEKAEFAQALERMTSFLTDRQVRNIPRDQFDTTVPYKIRELHRAEWALVELMEEIGAHLPTTTEARLWLDELIHKLIDHLDKGNADHEETIFTILDYIAFRRASSGMNLAEIMGEFNWNRYVPRQKMLLTPYKNLFDILKISNAYQDFGGLGNDLTLKEIMEEGSRVNIVGVIYHDLIEEMIAAGYEPNEVRLYAKSIVLTGQFLVDIKNFFFYVKEQAQGYLGLLLEGYWEEGKDGMRRFIKISEEEYHAFRRKLVDWEGGIRATYIWQTRKGFPRYNHELSPYHQFRPNEAFLMQIIGELGFSPELLQEVYALITQLQAPTNAPARSA